MNKEYFLVKGWYDDNKGLHNEKFYGAVCDLANENLAPMPVIVDGDAAIQAAEQAAAQRGIVYPTELAESFVGTGAIAIMPAAISSAPTQGVSHITGLKKTKNTPTIPKRGQLLDPVHRAGGDNYELGSKNTKKKKKTPNMPHNNPKGARTMAVSEKTPAAKRK